MRLASLTLFFPAHNEVDNVEPLTREALEVLPTVSDDFEVIIVDDGSSDGTSELADRLAEENPGKVVAAHNRPNRGYGGAVKRGFEESSKDWVFFTDGDRQFKLSELPKLVDLAESVDMVLGYRIKRSDPPHRLLNARMYKTLIRALFGLKVRDIDCAYKLIRRKVLQSIDLESEGALVSAELLIKASKCGYKWTQVGVHHYPRVAGEQSGAKLSVILRMFGELFRLRSRLSNYRGLREGATAASPK